MPTLGEGFPLEETTGLKLLFTKVETPHQRAVCVSETSTADPRG